MVVESPVSGIQGEMIKLKFSGRSGGQGGVGRGSSITRNNLLSQPPCLCALLTKGAREVNEQRDKTGSREARSKKKKKSESEGVRADKRVLRGGGEGRVVPGDWTGR